MVRTIYFSDKPRKQGPISRESASLVEMVEKFGSTDVITLRERLHLLRSRFWKNVSDLLEMNIFALKQGAD